MDAVPPPVLPPKPGSHETSRIGTPITSNSPRPGPGAGAGPNVNGAGGGRMHPAYQPAGLEFARPEPVPDPGDQWLPKVLQDKSKQDLADIATSPELLNALTHAPSTIHPSLSSSHQALQAALTENLELASRLVDLESRLAHQRSTTQAQLLSTHALERQWRQKQSDMDHALAPFSPASMYQRLGQGVHEQASVCHVLEESFIEGEGDGVYASERETLDWIKRYRDAKVLYYLRQERKERWDEGRVGGWR
ncbi:uncharacterized protein ColSpa_08575 [Colletotrichum spaethianum]|uniref:VPS37 C-terminal domain-containing protein n=1 Tax=Colletotrichum spaethianum TaxID=700344 RepID=A0AA37PA25_9PEZI|nr:uncharacterized protein ColSpa_08575 [Colletotrichum spaethianum]GKT48394.1 hypothetical protein ColSpa_08575 [Colletotrichum spaethianum]